MNDPLRPAPHDADAPPHSPGSLQPAYGDGITLLDLLVMVAKHKWLLILLPLLFAAAGVGWALLQPNIYTASAKILTPQQRQSANALALLSQLSGGSPLGLGAAKSANDIYVSMLKSRTVADALIKRFDLMRRYNVPYMSQARGRLAGAVIISAGKDGIIEVNVDDTDPQHAAQLANAYVDELSKLTQVLAVTEASQRRLFFERQFAQAKDNLARTEALARRALASRGVVNVDVQGRAMLETTARLRGQITVKEVQIGAMRAFAADDNPELRVAQRELESLKRELGRIEGEGDGKSPAADKSSQAMASSSILRDVKYHEVVFELLARQYEAAKIDEANDSSVIQVLDNAVPPELKSKPKRVQIVLLAFLAGLVVAIVIAFVREGLVWARADPASAARLEALRRHLRLRGNRP